MHQVLIIVRGLWGSFSQICREHELALGVSMISIDMLIIQIFEFFTQKQQSRVKKFFY